MNKELCCVNTKAIIDYIQKHSPDELGMLLEGLDPEIDDLGDPLAFLTDENNWTSSAGRCFSERGAYYAITILRLKLASIRLR